MTGQMLEKLERAVQEGNLFARKWGYFIFLLVLINRHRSALIRELLNSSLTSPRKPKKSIKK